MVSVSLIRGGCMTTRIAREHRNVQGVKASSHEDANIDDVERWVSGISGAALTLYGVRRGGVDGVALAALGAALLYRSVTGRSLLYQALDLRLVRTTDGRQRIEVVKAVT